jgi:hypothetical protein
MMDGNHVLATNLPARDHDYTSYLWLVTFPHAGSLEPDTFRLHMVPARNSD